jgi:hypothetical protein
MTDVSLNRLLNLISLNRLLDLISLNRCLDVLDPLLDGRSYVIFSLRIVNDLSLNWDVLNSFKGALNWLLIHDSLLDCALNVLDLSLNGIVVSNCSLIGNTFSPNDLIIFNHLSLKWNLNDSLNLFILSVGLFEGNIFNSALSGDVISLSSNS